MNQRIIFVVAGSLIAGLAVTPAANAQNILGGDVILTDTSPTIAYDDSDSVGYNWVVRGDDDGYTIKDDETDDHVLRVSPLLQSLAMGYAALADNGDSLALGKLASAAGPASTALGRSALSSGSFSIALGEDAESSGFFSAALGNQATASGASSIALGDASLAQNNDSIALGVISSATGISSMALGNNTSAQATRSVALGRNTQAVAVDSIAMGTNAVAAGAATASLALGYRAYTNQANAIVLGSIPGLNGGTAYANIGTGTSTPAAALHVARNNGTAQIYVEETNTSATPKTLFRISSNFNAKFEINNTDGALWAFTNAGTDFRISRQGSGVVEFSVANNGNATLSGALTQNSDVNAKRDIEAVDPDAVLEKVAALPVSTWAYKDAPDARHLGPMAQDFHAAFGLGESKTGISSIDIGGVALAAIQALEKQNRALDERNRALEMEVKELKALVMEILPRVVRN